MTFESKHEARYRDIPTPELPVQVQRVRSMTVSAIPIRALIENKGAPVSIIQFGVILLYHL